MAASTPVNSSSRPGQGSEDVAPLTWGIELEFLIPWEMSSPEEDAENDPVPDPRWWLSTAAQEEGEALYDVLGMDHLYFSQMLVQDLEGLGIPATMEMEMARPGGLDEARRRMGWQFDGNVDPEFQFWVVKPEAVDVTYDNDPEKFEHYNWYGMEITSPIFRDEGEFRVQLSQVLGVLRNGYRVHVNSACGVHVHLSEDRVGGLSLATLKRTIALYLLSEDRIFGLVHPDRPDGEHSWKITKGSTLVEGLGEQEPGAPEDPGLADWIPSDLSDPVLRGMMSRLWKARDRDELQTLLLSQASMGYSRRGAISVQQKGPEDIRARITLEGRQLQGTLDPHLVANWVSVLGQLVKIQATSQARYRTIVTAMWTDHGKTPEAPLGGETAGRESEDLLARLELPEDIRRWWRSYLETQRLSLQGLDLDPDYYISRLRDVPRPWFIGHGYAPRPEQ